MTESRWYEVTAKIKVQATSENDAVSRVVFTLSREALPGVHPHAEVRAEQVDDPDLTRHVNLPATSRGHHPEPLP